MKTLLFNNFKAMNCADKVLGIQGNTDKNKKRNGLEKKYQSKML